MSPIIGIAPCRSLPDYVESVRRAGGEPRVLDPLKDDPAQVTGEVDGVLMTGGVDIDPARYGEERHETVTAVEPERDVFEFALLLAAREARLPLFGICRGLQVMNVALGGSLIQDIAAQMAGILPHTVPAPPFALAHEVWVSKSSRLWTLMQEKMVDADTFSVNSRHHQAIKRAGPGVRGDGDGARRRDRSHRVPERDLLPRRPVAPRELLAHGRVPPAVRGFHRSLPEIDSRSRFSALPVRDA